MDVSMESYPGLSRLVMQLTPEKKKYPRSRSKNITPAMKMEDSGYSSFSSHDSESKTYSWNTISRQKDISRSPENLFCWKIISPKQWRPTLNVDLLVALSNYPHLLQKVLLELQPDDLVRCCLVSKAWYQICKVDSRAMHRRRQYLSAKGLKNKENLGLPEDSTSLQQPSSSIPRHFSSTPLAPVTASRQLNFCIRSDISVSPVTTSTPVCRDRFSVFVSEGHKLSPRKTQIPCPRCTLPARVDKDIQLGQCSQAKCRFQFCMRCRSEQHMDTSCPTQIPVLQIKWPRSLTSRASKRNLRRL